MNATADWLPLSQRLAVERRRHARALLSLPVRLRWFGPLGLESETTETLDAGRGGLLVSSREPRVEGTLVWVTFPFDARAFAAEPETPARIARSRTTPSGSCLAGIAFASRGKLVHQTCDLELSSNATGGNISGGVDRRRHARARLALPVRVRGADASWPDDAMTIDISNGGLSFCTLCVYEQGEIVTLALPRNAWLSGGDRRGRVVRISGHPSEPRLLSVGVEYLL